MKKIIYPVIFRPEEVGYSVIVPDLPGCFTQGETWEEAYEMAVEAMGIYLEDYEVPEYPKASAPDKIQVEVNDILALVEFDVLSYMKKFNVKSVKKTLTIPGWLNELAEKNHVNFSGVLQEELKEHSDVKEV